MFIICYVFAVIGYHYFGSINIQYTSYLNDHLNFSSFINSLITVFIFCTGEGWPFALGDCSGKTISYNCNPNKENCGSRWAIVYFITLQVIFSWILLNSFIAITVDTFVTVLEEHDEIIRLEKVWNAFNQQWIKYDWNKSGDLTFVELVNMYNSFKLPKGTEWGNQNRENGLLLVKPPIEEIFKNVKVYKNRCKYHDVIFGFLNSWMGEELPESFLIREKEKVKTGYEKKVFEKRKNSIYSLENSTIEEKRRNKTNKDKIIGKSKRIYRRIIQALSLDSSKKSPKDVNIHILVESVDDIKDSNNTDDDNTLNSNTPALEDEYIRMNMHTCSGRIQNMYTKDLINSVKTSGVDDKDITESTPTQTTTIFNLFEINKNNLSSETLNELNHSSIENENEVYNIHNSNEQKIEKSEVNGKNDNERKNENNDIAEKNEPNENDGKDNRNEEKPKEKLQQHKFYRKGGYPSKKYSSHYSSETSTNSNYLSIDSIFDQNKLKDRDAFCFDGQDRMFEKKEREKELEKDKELKILNDKSLKKSYPYFYHEDNHYYKRHSTHSSGASNPNYLSVNTIKDNDLFTLNEVDSVLEGKEKNENNKIEKQKDKERVSKLKGYRHKVYREESYPINQNSNYLTTSTTMAPITMITTTGSTGTIINATTTTPTTTTITTTITTTASKLINNEPFNYKPINFNPIVISNINSNSNQDRYKPLNIADANINPMIINNNNNNNN